MNWLSVIKNKYFPYIIIVILIAVVAFMFQRAQNQRRLVQIKEQNLMAMNDSIKIEKRKNGEIQASISGYIAREKDLKSLNLELAEKVNLEKGKVIPRNIEII